MPNYDDWNFVKSEAGIFSEMIESFGCKGLQVEEIHSLDRNSFRQLEPIHGLIFHYKWSGDEPPDGKMITSAKRLQSIFFMRQIAANSCAIQAILSVLLNIDNESASIKLGESLAKFKETCTDSDPLKRGEVLALQMDIRDIYNSFTNRTWWALHGQRTSTSAGASADENTFHYVAYVTINGILYELDGLREGPIELGHVPEATDWTDIARPIIKNRMDRYVRSGKSFNLLAVVTDRLLVYQREVDQLLMVRRRVLPRQQRNARLAVFRHKISEEIEKRKHQKAEITRHRHNFVPFIIELLKILGANRLLTPLFRQAGQIGKEQ